MTSVGPRARWGAGLLVFLLLASTIPVAMVTGAASPDLSKIRAGEVEPGDCLVLETAEPVLAKHLAQLQEDANDTVEEAQDEEGDPTRPALDRVADDEQVPMVCPQGNGTAFRDLVETGNELIRSVNGALDILEGQTSEARDTGTISYLLENFTGPRHGGLGSWENRSADGKLGFRTPIDPRVTPGYALTDQPGAPYEHGLNATLVFPAVDLGATALDPALVDLPGRAHRILQDNLPPTLGIPEDSPAGQAGLEARFGEDGVCVSAGVTTPATEDEECFGGGSLEALQDVYDAIRQAYVETGDEVVQQWLTNTRSGTLEVHHRYNLAQGLDGVRFEVLTSPPPRHGPVPAGTVLEPQEDSPGQGYDEVGSLGGAQGHTGDSDGWQTERFDLSPWTGQRIWIVARAVTSPAFGIPGFFEDPTLFDDDAFFGYAIDGAYVNGSALPHNLRALQIDADQITVDGRATVPGPLADRPVQVAVTNQGLEPTSAEISLRQCSAGDCTTWTTIGQRDLAPGEVATLEHPFPDTTPDNDRIRLEAKIEDARDSAPPDQRPGDNTKVQELLVERIERLDVRPAPGTTLGLDANPDEGSPEDERTVRLRLKNTGNVPLAGPVTLDLQDTQTHLPATDKIQETPDRQVHLAIGQTKSLVWKVLPAEPGIYEATAQIGLPAETVTGPDPTVHLYADRSPGVVCAENLEKIRACGFSWTRATDLPDHGDRFLSVAKAPGGELFALHNNGSALRFDGTTWSTVAKVASADQLITTRAGVLAVGDGRELSFVTASGTEAAAQPPLSRIHAIATDDEGRAVLAGPAGDTFGVAVGDGHGWRLYTPSSLTSTPSDPQIESVAPAGEDRFAVTMLGQQNGGLAAQVFLTPEVDGGGGVLDLVAEVPLDLPTEPIGPPFKVTGWQTAEVNMTPATKDIDGPSSPETRTLKVETQDNGIQRITFNVSVERSGQVVTTEDDEVQVDITTPNGTTLACEFTIPAGATTSSVGEARSCEIKEAGLNDQPTFTGSVDSEQEAEAIPGDDGKGTWTVDVTVDPGQAEGRDDPSYDIEVTPVYTHWTPQFKSEIPEAGLMALAPWGNSTALLAEDARSSHPGCTETLCAFRIFTDGSMDDPVRPLALPEGFDALDIQAIAGQGWALPPDGHEIPLYRIGAGEHGPAVQPVRLPGDGYPQAFGGGFEAVTAVLDRGLLEMTLPASYVATAGDWSTGQGLAPKTGGQVWTSVLEDAGALTGPDGHVYLRGTCTEQGPAGAAELTSCVDTAALDAPTEGYITDRFNLTEIEHLNLTLRYNLRDLGDRVPELRVLLEPGPTVTARDLLLRQLGDTDLGPTPYTLDPIDPAGEGQTPLLDEPAEVQDPQVVTVRELRSPTPDGWTTLTVPLTETLRDSLPLERLADLTGVEIAVPGSTEMAVDSLWLNLTQGSVREASFDERTRTLLSTDASGQQGSDQVRGDWASSSTSNLDRRTTAYHDDLLPETRDGYLLPGTDDGSAAWRISGDTHRPAWAYMGTQANGFELGADGIDRLVTPAVDLRQAERPILAFQHAYAFEPDGGEPRATGWVEAQVETAPGVWSQWVRLHPEGGYEGPADQENDVAAYWGANVNATPFEDFETLLDPQNWETARFDLVDQTTVLNGKRVRFAFNALHDGSGTAYEGWVISDLKVASAPSSAVDLELVDARFDESFNISRTGLPPGETVTLNVTLHNAGRLATQPGASLTWELIGIGTEERAIATGGTPLSTLPSGATTWVELPVRVPASFDTEIFPEEPGAYLRVAIEPGTGADEDPLNNVAALGTSSTPTPIKTTRDMEVRVDISPERGSPSRPRLIDVRLVNTGNTPLTGIEVDRTILKEQGTQGLIPVPGTDRSYETERVLPPGEDRSVAQLVQGSDADDRLWTPQRTGTFLVSASAHLDDMADSHRRVLISVDPFLRSSVETEASGTAIQGTFDPAPPWKAAEPGAFGTAQAWRLEPSDADVPANGTTFALDTPTVDLSPAREASVSFIHRFDLEERFDGARLEASVDDGERWFPLEPVATDEAVQYDDVLGGNPLADGNLSTPAFTGTSAQDGSDGWTLSTFDLSQIPGSVEPGEIARMDVETLTGEARSEIRAPASTDGPDQGYSHPSWLEGSRAASEVFFVENLTAHLEDRGPPGFLYTGTADHAEEAGWSMATRFEGIEIPELEEDQQAVLEWWEWAPVTTLQDTQTTLEQLRWHRGIASPAYPADGSCMGEDPTRPPGQRQLQPHVTEVDRFWRHYEVDVTDAGDRLDLTFQWLPWAVSDEDPVPDTASFSESLRGHPGLVVDGLKLRVFHDHASGEINPQVVWEEEWGQAERVAFLPEDRGSCELWPYDDEEDLSLEEQALIRDQPVDGLLEQADEIADRDARWAVAELEGPDRETNRVFSSSPEAEGRSHLFDASPLADSRLVLPALDLTGAGEDVELTFDHLPAFYNGETGAGSLTTGGVLEVSVFDPATGEWGSWEQVYSKPDQVDSVAMGGYNAKASVYTLPDPRQPAPLRDYESLPFEAHPNGLANGELSHLVYMYNGNPGSGLVSWENASYDLSRFSGERIRLGFHAFHAPYCAADQAYPEKSDQLSTPEAESLVRIPFGGCPPGGERWQVDNVTVEGKVFAGQPVELRFIGGMDGSIHNATWAVDEIEVLGTSYQKNVGLYTDDRTDLVAPEVPATWSGTVRNLGTDVRRDLAVRATVEGMPGEVELTVDGETTTSSTTATSQRFNLPASDAAPFSVDVTVPAGTEAGQGTLRLELVRWNEGAATFSRPTGEEVRTNLQRSHAINLTERDLRLADLSLDPVRVLPGQTSTVEAVVENPQAQAERVRVVCQIQRVLAWEAIPHDTETQGLTEAPVLADDKLPCRSHGPTSLAVAAGQETARFETQPETPGAYLVTLQVFRQGNDRNPALENTTILWAGDGPRALHEGFEDPAWRDDGQADGWSPRGDWSVTDEEAVQGNRSMLSGISASSYGQGQNYPTESTERLVSRPVDLHNVTEGRVHLSMMHMARLAFGDGADVSARVLVNEGAPEAEDSWTDGWCKLEPVGGYDGRVYSYHVQEQEPDASGVIGPGDGGRSLPEVDPFAVSSGRSDTKPSPDYNPALPRDEIGSDSRTGLYTKAGFFGTHPDPRLDQQVARWDEGWQLATFPLAHEDGTAKTCEGHPLTGRTVQFAFSLYKGEDDDASPTREDTQKGWVEPDPLERGRGQGWFIDSAAVVAADAQVSPETVTAPILDQAPKRLPVALTNDGPVTEHATVTIDRNLSTVNREEATASDTLRVGPNTTATGHLEVVLPRDPLAIPFKHTVVGQAQGLLDPNQPASTTYDLRFDPRVWPDLSAEILEPSDPPVEGVPSIVPIQITNHGRATSPPTELVLHDLTLDETVGEPLQIPSIPSPSQDPVGASTVVFAPWTPPSQGPDHHRLQVTLDPEDRIEEYTKDDNQAHRDLKVQPLLLPDLTFDEANITLDSPSGDVRLEERGTLRTYIAASGAPVTVKVPVANHGSAAALNVDIRLFLGSISLPAERIDRLEPGQSTTVSFTFLAEEGTRELSLEASTGSRDLEPGDNQAPQAGVIRLLGTSFQVDASFPDTVELDEPGTRLANLTLENTGSRGVLLDLTVQEREAVTYQPETTRVFVDPGEAIEVPGTVEVRPGADGGTHHLSVTASDHEEPELTAGATLAVHLAERHELTVSLAEHVLSPGSTTLTATFDNQGNLPEDLTVATVLADGQPSPPTQVSVPRGTQRTVDLAVTVPPTLGTGEHRLDLLLNGTLDDDRSFQVEVPFEPHPTLEPLPDDLAFTPEGLVLPVQVTNLGNAPLNGTLHVDQASQQAGASVQPAIADLLPGQTHRANVTVPDPEAIEDLSLDLQAQDGTRMARQALALPDGRPDLMVLQHQITPSAPAPGELTELRVTVANNGQAAARNMSVDMFVDDEFALRVPLDALDAGDSRTVEFTWPAFEGRHAMKVVLDPGQRIPDLSLGNNALVVLTEAGADGSSIARLIEEAREVPTPAPLIVLWAVLLAHAVIAWRRRHA